MDRGGPTGSPASTPPTTRSTASACTRASAAAFGAPPLLLLHGYPAEPRDLAARRAPAGRALPARPARPARLRRQRQAAPATPDHANYSKRAMAADLVALMRALGHERFGVVGHDRGGRVAHRMALDHPRARSSGCA